MLKMNCGDTLLNNNSNSTPNQHNLCHSKKLYPQNRYYQALQNNNTYHHYADKVNIFNSIQDEFHLVTKVNQFAPSESIVKFSTIFAMFDSNN